MPLHLRKRRASRNWYIYGTIKVGEERRKVEERSTGLSSKRAAEEYLARETQRIQDELIHGASGRARHVTFGMVAASYIERPGGLHPNDIWRIGEMAPYLEHCTMAGVAAGWQDFMKDRCGGLAPSTVDRFRSTLQAAMNHGCAHHKTVAPKIPPIRFQNKRVRYLTTLEQEALLAAYAPHVQAIAAMLCFQGCRTQEALQLDWRHVDLKLQKIFFERTKNGEPRTVLMHPRVFESVCRIHLARHEPIRGHVFLNRLGNPYADTRQYRLPGGNPIMKAHRTACRRAGIENFRPHDWRHHWASCAVMKGVDLPTIQKLGGWKKIDMVMRYAAVSTEHMDEAMRKMS